MSWLAKIGYRWPRLAMAVIAWFQLLSLDLFKLRVVSGKALAGIEIPGGWEGGMCGGMWKYYLFKTKLSSPQCFSHENGQRCVCVCACVRACVRACVFRFVSFADAVLITR